LHPDAEDAIAISLDVPADLRSEFVGLAGQHVVLRTELDGDETRRTYSLINAPGEWPLRIAARVHKNGQMSRHLAEQLKVGDSIDVFPPNGSLTNRRGGTKGIVARTYVGFASGCGITPVISIVKSVLAADAHSRFILFYGNSRVGRAMCLEELLGLKDRYMGRLALHFVMSREPQEIELYNGRIDAERVRELVRVLFEPGDVEQYFICGPGDMIDQVSGALRELNVGAERIHAEHFTVADGAGAESATDANALGGPVASGAADANAIAADAAASGDNTEVTVMMDGRRRSFSMRTNDETVLDAAARAGLDLPFSCRAGVCSTCRTKVISGQVEMAENYALEDWELAEGYVLACQSRAKTPTLELDYDEK
jgi:ring-1,2-phenylacetyl-CoA epoxidase subunit PaaE